MNDLDNIKQPALFLDRDGIINIDHGYVYKKEDFKFIQGIFDLIRLFSDQGYLIFVVTNQSGIGRGYYTQDDFETLTQWMINELKQKDISIEKVLYCPHAPEAKCSCRKPNTGLIDEIVQNYPIDFDNSYLLGDKQSDIDLAVNAGIKNRIYIGDKRINNSTLTFKTVLDCQYYLEEKNAKIGL